ncbi:MAG: DeoR/GlpR family DNA-binding transcription regulator [Planctomycetota bacterium]|jgi:DeoR/GlpR family transcriptional regulator of sugar metabolism|nr:DeoR/GlpR family DNA-binding transcription regulator [Planctomycetota bacterium]
MNAMSERHARILDRLAEREQATVRELAELGGVSVVTIRQDLSALEKAGYIRRTHGGAALLETDNIARRLSIRHDKKLRIARLAASLVEEGETVLVESGSANALLARELAGRRVTIVAANLFVARQAQPGDPAAVVALGGLYQPESEGVVGTLAKTGIEKTHFSKAFIGMDGFTPASGFTNSDMMRAEIGAAIVARCRRSFVLGDSSKFGKTSLSRVCGLDDLEGVITDSGLAKEREEELRAGRAALLLA